MLFELAGPPSSGKTTALEYLKKKFLPRLKIYEEINPYTFFKEHKGGAYVDFELEVRIIDVDLARTREIVSSGEPALLETGVFHLAYLKRFVDRQRDREKEELYGYFKGLYESLPLQKVMFKNNYRKEEGFLREVEGIVAAYLDND